MRHDTCRKNLSAYLDNELHEDERHALEEHLESCRECRDELQQLRSLSGLVKKHGMEPVPPALRETVFGRPKRARSWFKPVLALSAAAAGLLVVFNLTKPDGTTYMATGFGSRDSSGFAMRSDGELYEPALASKAEETQEAAVSGGAAGADIAMKAAPALPAEEKEPRPSAASGEKADNAAVVSRKARASAAVLGAMKSGTSGSPVKAELSSLSEKKENISSPCFCISPSRNEDSPYSVMRLPGDTCSKDSFRPQENSAASAYLPPCPAGLPAENAVDLREACFCVNYTPDKLPPYNIGRIASPDCAYVNFRPRAGAAAPSYLQNCSR